MHKLSKLTPLSVSVSQQWFITLKFIRGVLSHRMMTTPACLGWFDLILCDLNSSYRVKFTKKLIYDTALFKPNYMNILIKLIMK